MPRQSRVVAVGVAHHITQRGNARQEVFTTDAMRSAYLRLLSEHAALHHLRILAYCIMTNHVHVVAVPEREASMANTFRHAHGRFSQYWNTERRRTGHVWQNRYYSCPVEEAAVGRVIAYVEENPVRAGMVERADDFFWSSARSHVGIGEPEPWLDSAWFEARWTSEDWRTVLASRAPTDREEDLRAIREATYLGRPLGSKTFNCRTRNETRPETGSETGRTAKEDTGCRCESTGALDGGVVGRSRPSLVSPWFPLVSPGFPCGYLDFERLYRLTLAAAFFVTRTKENVCRNSGQCAQTPLRKSVPSPNYLFDASNRSDCPGEYPLPHHTAR